eukprot:3529559-Rhodomonas_salina.1
MLWARGMFGGRGGESRRRWKRGWGVSAQRMRPGTRSASPLSSSRVTTFVTWRDPRDPLDPRLVTPHPTDAFKFCASLTGFVAGGLERQPSGLHVSEQFCLEVLEAVAQIEGYQVGPDSDWPTHMRRVVHGTECGTSGAFCGRAAVQPAVSEAGHWEPGGRGHYDADARRHARAA